MSLEYVLVFIVGLILGAVLGHEVDDLVVVAKAAWRGHHVALTTEHDRVVRSGRSLTRSTLILLAVLVVAQVGIGVAQIVTYARQQNLSKCVNEYNQQFSVAYNARLSASQEASDALDAIVAAISKDDQTAFRAAVADYVAQRDKVKKAQVTNPFPAVPDTFCGGDP